MGGAEIACDCIYLTENAGTSYILLTAFDTASKDSAVSSVAVLGNSGNYYCSEDTFYVIAEDYNYKDNMKFLREMLQYIIEKLFGTLIVKVGDKEVDLSGEWEAVSFRDLILKYGNIDINEYNTKELLLQKIYDEKLEIDCDTPLENLGYGNLVDQLYKKVARPNVVNPIFFNIFKSF